jgi:hypothetical protein
MSSALQVAQQLEGGAYLQIRRAVIPTCAHPILSARPEVRELSCNKDNGNELVGEVAKACREMEVFWELVSNIDYAKSKWQIFYLSIETERFLYAWSSLRRGYVTRSRCLKIGTMKPNVIKPLSGLVSLARVDSTTTVLISRIRWKVRGHIAANSHRETIAATMDAGDVNKFEE